MFILCSDRLSRPHRPGQREGGRRPQNPHPDQSLQRADDDALARLLALNLERAAAGR